jgi:photosystem II stability/assembly factor-like uncharacterized protein
MMRTYILRVFIFSACLSAASIVYAGMIEMEWKDISSGIRGAGLHSLAVCTTNPEVAYAGSYKAVYRTADGGKTWTEILSFRGTDNGIHTLAADPLNQHVIYAGTTKGLYRSSDQGLRWERVFEGLGDMENTIFAVSVNSERPEKIYIGTQSGIFFTEDGGENWVRGQNLPSEIMVTSISADAYNPHVLYAASARGIYKSVNSGAGWERIYEADFNDEALHYFIAADEGDSEEADVTGMRDTSHIRKILTYPADSRIIYAGTSRGLLVTTDGGLTWAPAGSIGLTSHNIRDIAISSADINHVYAATDRGVFRYSRNTDSWDELYKGMASSDIRNLALDPDVQNGPPSLWAVTKTGVYKSFPSLPASAQQHTDSQPVINDPRDVLSIFNHEPSIAEIKEAAIEYAEVSPNKIREWRKAVAKSAWLPDLSMSYGKSEDWQDSSYFYSTKDEKYKDDDITEGDDEKWAISLTWHLGELIWNNDQTSIDNRSKLMVQLRDDVLNEVTRLYFERRRLQIDLVMSPPGDNKVLIEKDLRLQELTANIDALTGSFLSRRLAQQGIGAQRQDLKVK